MKTLLVLEDEPMVMEFLLHILRGFGLIEATTAEQALRLFLFHRRKIDLVIADVALPTSSGIQLALLLRLALPNLPVILTSGYPVSDWGDRNCADLARLGSESLLIVQKPFQGQSLSNAIHDLIGAAQPKTARPAGGAPS